DELGALQPRLALGGSREPLRQVSGIADRALDRVALDHPARLDHVLELLGGDRDHQRAPLRVQLQQALGLELLERAAHRRAAHAERLGDLALADQLSARELAGEHAVLDVPVRALARGLRHEGILVVYVMSTSCIQDVYYRSPWR